MVSASQGLGFGYNANSWRVKEPRSFRSQEIYCWADTFPACALGQARGLKGWFWAYNRRSKSARKGNREQGAESQYFRFEFRPTPLLTFPPRALAAWMRAGSSLGRNQDETTA